MTSSGNGHSEGELWRGIDFSGLTVVLGIGTGQLIAILNQQAHLAGGQLLVTSRKPHLLKTLLSFQEEGPLTLLLAHPRHLPLIDECADLVVINGILREIPESGFRTLFEEIWRILVPGGNLRISDVIEPLQMDYNQAWSERNRIVRKLGEALGRPTALSVDIKKAANALRAVGFADLGVSLLPGYNLTDAWLEDTVNAIRMMASRVSNPQVRSELAHKDVNRLVSAYKKGGQRAAERFVLRAKKVGNLSLDMEASFTEDDLHEPD